MPSYVREVDKQEGIVFILRQVRFTVMVSFIALVSLALVFQSSAQDCIDYGDYVHWVGGVLPSNAECVVVQAGYAYVTGGYGTSLEVIDISEPNTPGIVGDVELPCSGEDIAVQGDYIYISNGSSHPVSFIVIDISTPEAPELVGSLSTTDYARGVAVQGNYAYLANGGLGLTVIDITDPVLPVVVGSVLTPYPYNAGDVAVGVYISAHCRQANWQDILIHRIYLRRFLENTVTKKSLMQVWA